MEVFEETDGNEIPLPPMHCLQCNQNFQDTQIFESHLRQHQMEISKSDLTCWNCGCMFNDQQDLLSHQVVDGCTSGGNLANPSSEMVYEEEREYEQCSHCGILMEDEKSLKTHLKTVHEIKKKGKEISKVTDEVGGDKKKCSVFNNKEESLNSSPQEFKCSECDYVTPMYSRLKSHQLCHTKTREWECWAGCGKTFIRRGTLLTHVRELCPLAKESGLAEELANDPKKFGVKRWGKFLRRARDAKKQRNLKCPHCPETFIYHSYLRWHIFAHGAEFPCPFCSVSFRATQGLTSHVKKYHPEKNFARRKKSKNSKGNKDEISENSEEDEEELSRFRCKVCFVIFGATKALRRHERKFHPNNQSGQNVKMNNRQNKFEKSRQKPNERSRGRKKKCRHCGKVMVDSAEFFTHVNNMVCQQEKSSEEKCDLGKGKFEIGGKRRKIKNEVNCEGENINFPKEKSADETFFRKSQISPKTEEGGKSISNSLSYEIKTESLEISQEFIHILGTSQDFLEKNLTKIENFQNSQEELETS